MVKLNIVSPNNFRLVLQRFQDTVREMGNPKPLLKKWGIAALKDIDETFKAGGRPKWTPLAASTVAARRIGKGTKRTKNMVIFKNGAPKPLMDTGKLRKSFNAQNIRINDTSVIIFSNDPVAIFHEYGTKGPYEIRPKNAKFLAIPTGPMTLAGLARSPRAPTGNAFILAGGKRVPKRIRHRIGKRVLPYESLTFALKVTHPGLVPRPMLPDPQRLAPVLNKIALRDLMRHFQKKHGGVDFGL